jgi:chromosome segregation ATPase
MLIGLLVVYFIYVRKYNVNKREGAADGPPETEEEMNEEVDKYLELLNACTNLDPNSDEYKARLGQQTVLADEIKAGFNEKIERVERLKDDKDDLKEELKAKISGLKGQINVQNDEIERMGATVGFQEKTVNQAQSEVQAVRNQYEKKKDNLNKLIAKAKNVLTSAEPQDTESAA